MSITWNPIKLVSTHVVAIVAVLCLALGPLAGCSNEDNSGTNSIKSSDEVTYQANTYCTSGLQNQAFNTRQDACLYYQSHFVPSAIGTPEGLLDYITTSKSICEMNHSYCLKYWTSVSNDEHLKKYYPGIDVNDSRVLRAKIDAVETCIDDSHPLAADGFDVKPDVCLQAALLLRDDGAAQANPALLTKVEKKACDLGDVYECHNATMDGETVDIKASEALQAKHEKQRKARAEQGDYGPGLKLGI